MAEYNWGSEKAQIKLGKPYLFTKTQYEYCKQRHAPIAIIYYDTKTSILSKKLYESAFNSKENVKKLFYRLSSHGIKDISSDKFKGGYCSLMILNRCGNTTNPTPDQTYFKNEFLKSDNFPFVVLALHYDGKTYCHRLPAVTSVDELADAIYKKCESGEGGMIRFSDWPGREEWISHQIKKPDQEVKPEKSGQTSLDTGITSYGTPPYWEDPTSKKKYNNYDSNYSGVFNGITKINNRPDVQWALNLADVSTPETTYYLIGAYDQKYPDSPPWVADRLLTDRVVSDNKVWTKGRECQRGEYKNLYEKGKRYRFFIFYEFSHGYTRGISICSGFTYDYIWNHLSNLDTTQRVWGIFDSCHSGSMITHDGITPSTAAQFKSAGKIENAETAEKTQPLNGLFEYIDSKFARRSGLLLALSNDNALTASGGGPRLTLWACTGKDSYGWYNPMSNTSFTNGIRSACISVYYDSGTTKYTYDKIRYGWAGARDGTADYVYSKAGKTGEGAFKKIQGAGSELHGDDTLNTCIPQCRNYPQKASPETTIMFY